MGTKSVVPFQRSLVMQSSSVSSHHLLIAIVFESKVAQADTGMTRSASILPVVEKIHLVTAGTSDLTVFRVDDFLILRISALIFQNSNTLSLFLRQLEPAGRNHVWIINQ